jgi:hypothetical protein
VVARLKIYETRLGEARIHNPDLTEAELRGILTPPDPEEMCSRCTICKYKFPDVHLMAWLSADDIRLFVLGSVSAP